MAETMEKFLKKYYKHLHFNSMPPEVKARFNDWVKQDSLTDDMRLWVRDYYQKPLPDPSDDNALPEDEARLLFIAFQNAFAAMNSGINSFKDKEPQSAEFVQKYFGNGKLFNISPATQDCEAGINQILTLLKDNNSIKDYIVKNTKKDDGKNVFENQDQLDELLDKCDRGDYNSDASVQSKIKSVAQILLQVTQWDSTIPHDSAEFQAIQAIQTGLEDVTADNAFSMDPKTIDDNTLRDFRTEYAKNPEGLLQTLYKNKIIRDRFSNYDINKQITKHIYAAEEAVNWQDKEKGNYVDPKYSDVLTPLQQIEKWVDDTYSNTIKKYEELRGGRKFFRQEAKDIFKAIDSVKVDGKKGIRPKDGLSKVLDHKTDILNKISNPVAKEHFNWFVETMEPLKAKMPKAFEGAWRNANQMKAIITEVILKATDPNNPDPHAMEKAKTTMEIMTAMKYGKLTSNVMDAFKSQEFSMFSDGKLSWNKNEGIQFVTKAFDKGLKAAFTGIGYGIVFVKNGISLSGRKFKDKNNANGSNLAQRFADEKNRLSSKKTEESNLINAEIANARRDIQTNQQILDNISRQGNIEQKKQRLETLDQTKTRLDADQKAQKNIMNQNKRYFDKYEHNLQEINASNDKITSIRERNTNITQKITDLRNLLQTRNYIDPVTNQPMDPADIPQYEENLHQQITDLQTEFGQNQTEITNEQARQQTREYIAQMQQLRQENANLQTKHDAYVNAEAENNRIQQDIDNFKQQNNYDALKSDVDKFNAASASIAELQDVIRDRETALSTWDNTHANKVLELENYWNFLQSGKTSTWAWNLNKQQKKFDINKQFLLNQYTSNYGLAA